MSDLTRNSGHNTTVTAVDLTDCNSTQTAQTFKRKSC